MKQSKLSRFFSSPPSAASSPASAPRSGARRKRPAFSPSPSASPARASKRVKQGKADTQASQAAAAAAASSSSSLPPPSPPSSPDVILVSTPPAPLPAFPSTFHSSPSQRAQLQQLVSSSSSSPSPSSSSSSAAANPRASPPARARGGKFTPLEQQVVAIKAEHPDVLLLVEVGYKYRFFGEDATTAARVLGIQAFYKNNFLTASVPTYRLSVHLQRLVQAGLKVGVVRQVEHAATKKKAGTRGPFVRRLETVYTAATYVSDDVDRILQARRGDPSRYVFCVFEEPAPSSRSGANVTCHFVAVDPTSGDVCWDSFADTFSRGELSTRLSTLQPCELVLDRAQLSDLSWRVIQEHAADARIEQLPHFNYASALADVSELLPGDVSLPPGAITCLGVLIRYLRTLRVEKCLQGASFRHFTTSHAMYLDATTLANLDILVNSDTGRVDGSLFALLNQTRTPFGARLLRRWVAAPLLDRERLEARLNAVSALVQARAQARFWLASVEACLSNRMPDLERSLAMIQHGRCKPKQFVGLLGTFRSIVTALPAPEAAQNQIQDPTLLALLALDKRQEIAAAVEEFAAPLHVPDDDSSSSSSSSGKKKKNGSWQARMRASKFAAKPPASEEQDRLVAVFRDLSKFPTLAARQQQITAAESALRALLAPIRQTLGTGYAALEYKKVAREEFLIEVKHGSASRVPDDWVLVNKTKKVARYRPPEVTKAMDELEFHREQLRLEAATEWRAWLARFSERYTLFRGVVARLAELDCLLSLATVASWPGYVRPVLSGEKQLVVQGGRHPMVENQASALPDGQVFVANDIRLGDSGLPACSSMIITGPNMGGKSSYVRSMALIAIMAQIGSFVPAEACTLGLYDGIFTRMGARDDAAQQMSTFLVELSETSTILRRATRNSLVILDELGRGTSTHDGQAIAAATMEYLVSKVGASTLFITHYPALASLEYTLPSGRVGNFHMAFLAGQGATAPVTFLYKLKRGLCNQSYGINVARLAGVPPAILDRARSKATELRRTVEAASRDATPLVVSELGRQLVRLLTAEAPQAAALRDLQLRINKALQSLQD